MSILISAHIVTALSSLVLGGYILMTKKGTAIHKKIGRIYAVLMLITAFSSFFITGINGDGFSIIHILSIVVIVSITRAIFAIRNHNVTIHQQAMKGAYLGLWGAFIFTFLPDRQMYNVVVDIINFLSN